MGWRLKCLGVVPDNYEGMDILRCELPDDHLDCSYPVDALAPVRIRDFLYAFAQPEYRTFRSTFDGLPAMRRVAAAMESLATHGTRDRGRVRGSPRSGPLSRRLLKMMWSPSGTGSPASP